MFTLNLPATEAHYVPPVVMQCVGCAASVAGGQSHNPTSWSFYAAKGVVTIASSAATSMPPAIPPMVTATSRKSAAEIGGVYIQVIDCGTAPHGRLATIFSPERTFSAGWSHIDDPGKAADFTALQQPPNTYSINSANLRVDASCNGEKTYRATLVKKLHTWNNTHANGLETTVNGTPVGDIDSVVVELKLNSAGSVIPSPKQIRAAYPRLTRKQLRNLDKGMANIDLVFSAGELRANKVLTIDPQEYADKWLRITIPMEKMHYYREVDYKRTYTTYQAAGDHRFTGLVINAESQHRKTVQHLTDGRAGAVQLFKELDVSIRRIGYVMK